jgi:hypothetical protein
MPETADKYRLTKDGKGDVTTSSESVKHRHLADGYTLHELQPGASVEVPVVANYDALTVPELKDKIAARNADRPDEDKIMSPGGNKGDLIAALQLDDEN